MIRKLIFALALSVAVTPASAVLATTDPGETIPVITSPVPVLPIPLPTTVPVIPTWFPLDPPPGHLPRTGTNTDIALLGGGFMLAGVGAVMVSRRKRV